MAKNQIKEMLTPYQHKFLALGVLRRHPIVQRVFNETRARRIRDHFDPDKFAALSVNNRRRKFLVFDGQHRLWAVIEWLGEGYETVEIACHVYDNLSDKECAAIALGHQDANPWTALAKWVQRGVAREKRVLEINGILKSFDLEVNDKKVDGIVSAVATLEYLFELDGPMGLRRYLKVAADAWGKESAAYEGNMLRGLGMVLHVYDDGKIDDATLALKLQKHAPAAAILGRARALHDVSRLSTPRCVSEIIVNVYNKGRRSGGLPPLTKVK